MTLATATRLGPYEILGPLGAGGMGEVYRATDTRLGRVVALKVLPEDFLEGKDRKQRFEREARTLASLNHPNVAVVYSFEEIPGSSASSSSTPILTMELLEGESLREVIARGAVPVRRALEIAEQAARGLAAAHEKGIVHRDVKPENVIVTTDGHVKVIDFGLARSAVVPAGRNETESPTVEKLTTGGAVVGTVAYMSPEQARGLAADHRSDQFSLGVVLYEMLSGRRPFKGDSAAETLTAIIREEPEPITRAGPAIPAPVWWIVERCLAKEPVDRYDSTRDLARELASCRGHLSEAASGVTFAAEAGPAHVTPRRRTLLFGVLAVVLFGAVLAGAGFLVGRGRNPQRASTPQFSFRRLTSIAGWTAGLSVSPRGDTVAYAAEKAPGVYHIFTVRVGGRNPVDLLPDFAGINVQPSYSPDGSSIAFRATRDGGGIFVMGATGESPRRLTTFGHAPAWFPDGRRIVFSSVVADPYSRWGNGVLWTVDVPGGTPKKLYEATDAVQPSVSPHGLRVAFWGMRSPGSTRDVFTIAAAEEAGGAPVPVTQDDATDWSPYWSPDGRSLYFASDRSGVPNLWRVPIDERSGRLLGAPEPVPLPGVLGSRPSISADGRRIAYLTDLSEDALERLPLGAATGKVSGNPTVVVRGTAITCFGGMSPNGDSLSYWEDHNSDLWLVRPDGTGIRRLTDDGKNNRWSRFSSDGKRIYFQSARAQTVSVWSIGTDGSELAEMIRHPTADVGQPLPSPDGRSLVVFSNDEGSRIVPLPTARDTPLPPLLPALGGDLFLPWAWSPDSSRLLGTAKKRTGGTFGTGLYLFDVATREYAKLKDTGTTPLFLPDGKQILFLEGRRILLFDLTTRATREILTSPPGSVIGALSAVAPDGQSLYIVRTTPRTEIWTADFSAPPLGGHAP